MRTSRSQPEVVLITGASKGIGAALPVVLANRFPGVRLVLAARSLDRLEAVADTCRQAGAEVCVVPTDMAEVQQVQALAQTALNRFGRIDAVVNNAGYGQVGPIELVSMDLVRQQFEVNLLGVIALVQAVIPVMRQQGGGRIINVSSIGGRVAFPLGGLYSTSKFALEGLSDVLRMELEPFNIRVSVIEPGPVRTEFFNRASQQMQQAVADPGQTPYADALQHMVAMNQRLMSMAWSSEQVAEVIVKALTDRQPKPRYVAATGGNVMLWLMTKLLPTRLVDLFWQRFYGIDRIAKVPHPIQSASTSEAA
ncbi:MAG: SDR family NAD(P)-dependent oxidoreductase [Elainella sp.]